MRFKFLILTLVTSLVAVSAAAGKGKPPRTGDGCRPSVKVVLAGVLGADVDPADGDTSFVLTVKHSNRFGRAWQQAGSATINVDQKTKVRRQGANNLGALAPNDLDPVERAAKAIASTLKSRRRTYFQAPKNPLPGYLSER